MRISDWSSDVCSSDLFEIAHRRDRLVAQEAGGQGLQPCIAIGIERSHPARASAHVVPQGRFGWLGFGACEQASDQRTHARTERCQDLSGTCPAGSCASAAGRSEEPTSELQSLMRISYADFCLKKKNMNK